jgi:hypothetical protein
MTAKWTVEENMPVLEGKTAIVTGGNSGLGYEAALALAGYGGARVLLTARDRDKGEAARERILEKVPGANVQVTTLDLANITAVRKCASEITDACDRLDLLINNAGVMALPRLETVDGFEMQLGTNHLGHFALTGLLLDLLQKTPHSRIVTVSSGYHRLGRIDFDDLHRARRYDKWEAYGQSKVANLHFAYELQRKLEVAGSSTISVAAHPGYAATNLQYAGPKMRGAFFAGLGMRFANTFIAQSAAMGSLPLLFAATAPEVSGGDYIGPDGWQEMKGYPRKVESNEHSRDREVSARLWQVSEELTGVRYATLSARQVDFS